MYEAWPKDLPDNLRQVNFYGRRANSVVLVETDPLRFFQMFFGRLLGVDGEEIDLLPGLV